MRSQPFFRVGQVLRGFQRFLSRKGGWAVWVLGACWQAGTVSAAPLPTFGPVAKPNPEPALPAAFDAFTAPTSDGLPTTPSGVDVPEVAEYTRTGGPDDSLALSLHLPSAYSGNDLGKDSRFLVYGEHPSSGEGWLTDARVMRLTSVGAVLNLDAALPAWSMYLLWPGNANGYGKPVAINRTDAWWIGPNTATRGDTVSVFGRNLAHDNGTTTSWLYLKPSSGSGQWLTVTAANPYKVDFTVPSNLANGTYEIWAHNGHGASLGWSGPLTLTVNDGPMRGGAEIDVTTRGVVGDGVTDNTATIISLVGQYRNTGSTLYFPPGTYKITGALTTPPMQMVLKGAGKGLTILKAQPPSPPATSPTYIFPNQMHGTEIRDMTVDVTAFAVNSLYSSVFWATSSTDLRLKNIEVLTVGNPVGYFHNNTLLRIEGCDFHGTAGAFLGKSKQIFIDSCKFYGMFDSTTMVYSWGCIGVSVTRSEGHDHDPSNPASGMGFSSGRFYTGSAQWGTEKHIYIGQNQTFDLTPRELASNQNEGEQLMWEATSYRSTKNPTAAGPNTVTLSDLVGVTPSTQIGLALCVISGKGLGQTRDIIALDSATGTVTVDRPWDVIPDTNSRIVRLTFFEKMVAYDNDLDFKARAAYTWPNDIASSGVQPFSGAADFIADSNRMTEPHYGVSLWAGELAGSPAPIFFPLIVNNTAEQALIGVRNVSFSSEGFRQFGTVFRNNSFDSSGIANSQGILLLGSVNSGPSFSHCVWEKNQVLNAKVAVEHGVNRGPSEHEVFYKNTLTRGTAPSGGSKGFFFHSLLSPAFRENTVSGFETTYAGAWPTPSNPLELPYRRADLGGALGLSASLLVWDAGTTALNWSASSNQPWLSIVPGSGTVTDQFGTGAPLATVNPAGLAAGTHTAEVTVVAGSQTKKIQVNYTASDLVAAYEFDDEGDSQADDSSGFERHGTLVNGATWSSDTPSGTGASIFTPAGAWVQTVPWNSPTSAITVSAWAKANASNFQGNACIACKRDAFILYPLGGTKIIRFYVHIGWWVLVEYNCANISGFQVNQWHHYAGTYDQASRQLQVYVDGVLRGTVTLPSYSTWPITADSGIMTIGRDEGTENFFKGWIDNARVYKRALSAAEIAELSSY